MWTKCFLHFLHVSVIYWRTETFLKFQRFLLDNILKNTRQTPTLLSKCWPLPHLLLEAGTFTGKLFHTLYDFIRILRRHQDTSHGSFQLFSDQIGELQQSTLSLPLVSVSLRLFLDKNVLVPVPSQSQRFKWLSACTHLQQRILDVPEAFWTAADHLIWKSH